MLALAPLLISHMVMIIVQMNVERKQHYRMYLMNRAHWQGKALTDPRYLPTLLSCMRTGAMLVQV